MKKQFFTILLSSFVALSVAQTAINFTATDCSGISHDLFSDLDSGKVVVICWVMPCSACVSGALTTYNVVQSYGSTYPGKVIMYLCDDYANTVCSSLNSWADAHGLSRAARFSNASINMTDYGTTGMPKIVVLGGADHAVLYNANYTVNASSLQGAIDVALTTTGIHDIDGVVSAFNLIPNPASTSADIKFNLTKDAEINIDLFNIQGELINHIYSGRLASGENNMPINVSAYRAGTYFVKLSEGNKSRILNLVVTQ
ncbi:MAG: T9SS type A sorting domain-containing protein [Saprospiraceae bacterium]|uniref:T9SS type A sorting domain-containing protein n=1 Tax=Candidatus Opimibacter skivensis TaxID=2982028 RepID=A0A9D7XRX5_9BACT|nr:T9SS type A sorting domain-containing protein [Candidatus Opimibacter skivensis]